MNTEPTPIARVADGTPERLGRYRIVRPISTGGMARVFEARRESLAGVSPRVAIKVILPDFADNRPFQELFAHEARIGSMLQHQNVVQIQDFDCQDGLYYLVMEYVEGVTLRRIASMCRRHGAPVPLDVIAEIGRQVCDGLAHAHSSVSEEGQALNLVHRDIKPSNLMINPQGVVKLLDFGISKGLTRREHAGAVRGTWGYMSPEQAEGGSVTAAADLFGLAAVLYELAAVQPLFPEKEPDIVKSLLNSDDSARRAAKMPREYAGLARILVRALQRDPAARFGSALAMGRALASLVQDPLLARERLIRFQEKLMSLNNDSVRPASSAPKSAEAVVVSRTGQTEETGLPIAIGDVVRPVRPVRRVSEEEKTERIYRVSSLGLPVFMVAAMAILSFTTYRLWQEGSVEDGTSESPALVKAAAAAPEAVESPPVPPKAVQKNTPAPSQEVRSDVKAPAEQSVPAPEVASEAVAIPVEIGGEGVVTISSIPTARVSIDGKFVRTTPVFRHTVKAGAREVTLKAGDGRSHSFTLDVRDGADISRVWSFEAAGWVGGN
jgi:serine/threonine protein kinase